MTGRRIAVIGGVSGITVGYVLSRTDHVTLFEAGDRLGGHADTHPIGVDTGFIPLPPKRRAAGAAPSERA